MSIAKVVEYTPEKGNEREFKRTLPDVRSAFHVMNWRVMYPVTIQDEDLSLAFLSIEGVQNLIGKIVDSVYTAAQYDEFLLFKYLLIKAISHGRTYTVSIGDGLELSKSAVQFRGVSNLLPFMSDKFNNARVKTNTPKDRQVIFMDSMFNAQFDVNVLAGAFNMDKADFMGRLFLIDNWTSFDNERFEIIRDNSDGIEEVTTAELALLANVKAVMLDENWFQVYDNNNKFTEKYVASGLYWNYFYHVWKTVSSSPFANAVTFVTSNANTEIPESITVHISMKDETDEATVFTLDPKFEQAGIEPRCVNFVQTKELTTAGIAVQKYGALIIPKSQVATNIKLVADILGTTYTATTNITGASAVDARVTLTKG